MGNRTVLNEKQIQEIRTLARGKRQELGFLGEPPVAKDIFMILDRLNIKLLEYPISSESEKPAFSAALIYSKESNQELVFIGLNTADYFDRQIFAVAQELYHFYIKSGSHLSRPEEEVSNIIEAQANRFAAEFLLPESTLQNVAFQEFGTYSLLKSQTRVLLRFIARLQCTWWLPYRSIVKRLKEINAISVKQYDKLYSIDERDMFSEYGRIGKAIDNDIFLRLNTITNNIGTSPKNIEIIIRNYEDGIISEDKFVDTLGLFHKKPDDFGYTFKIPDEDILEWNAFFDREAEHGD